MSSPEVKEERGGFCDVLFSDLGLGSCGSDNVT